MSTQKELAQPLADEPTEPTAFEGGGIAIYDTAIRAQQEQLVKLAEQADLLQKRLTVPSKGLMQFIEGTFKTNGDPTAPSIVQALSAVMADVRVVKKDGKNTAPGGGYNFRGIDAVVNAVGPRFREHGIVCTPKLISHTGSTVTVGAKQSVMQWVTIVVRYRFHGPAGDHLDAVVPGEAMDSGDKAMAKAMSVAYRTALLQVLTLPTDEPDPDESTYQRSDRQAEQPAAPPADPTPADLATEARARLLEVCTQAGVSLGAAVTQFAEMNNGADLRFTEDHYAVDRFTQWMQQQWTAARAAAADDNGTGGE